MSNHRSFPRSGAMVAMSIVVIVAGCRHVPVSQPGQGSDMMTGGNEPNVAMKPTQQAGIEYALGRNAERQNDVERAMAAYTEAVKHDSGRADAYLRLAILHDRRGQPRESEAYYRKAIQANPGNPEIFCDMGYSLYLQSRWAESEMNLRQAIAIRPDLARAHNNLGLLLVQNRKVDEAVVEFQRAGNSAAEAHENAAFALSTNQRWDDARRQYQLALIANPASEVAKDRLGQMNTLVARLNTAPVSPSIADPAIARASANNLPALPQ